MKTCTAVGKWVTRHRILILLFTINLLNYCDRYTLAATLPTIQNSSNTGWGQDLDDTKSGLLQTVFVVSLAVCSPVVGYFADRYSRIVVLVIGVLLWCAATLGCSFANSYGVFIFFRSLVGVGEGTYTVVAPTLLGDLYSAKNRVLILSIFYFAIPVGTAGGFEIGQAITDTLGWRWAFRITPAVGAVVTLLFALVARDPGRGVKDAGGGVIENRQSLWADLKEIMKVKTYLGCVAGSAFSTFVTGALGFLGPTLFFRAAHPDQDMDNDNDTGNSTFVLGVIVGLAGVTSSIGAVLLSKLLKRWTKKADCLICGAGMLVAVPSMITFLQVVVSMVELSYFCAFVGVFGALIPISILTSVTLEVLPPTTRSIGQGVLQVISHAFGDAASPLLLGILSDQLHTKYGYSRLDGLRWSLESCVVATFLGSLCFFAAAFSLESDKRAVDTTIAAHARLQINSSFNEDESTRLLDPAALE